MAQETGNPRDNVAGMGASGKEKSPYVSPGRVNGIGSASNVPSYTNYEDFDVFSGGKGLSQKDYMNATFHTSDMMDGDDRFKMAADNIQGVPSSLLTESRRFRTAEDVGEEEDLNAQEKEAAL